MGIANAEYRGSLIYGDKRVRDDPLILQKRLRTSLELSRLYRHFETDPSPSTLLQLVEFLERDIWFLSVNKYHWCIICKIALTCYLEQLDDPDKTSRLMLCLANVYQEGRFVTYFQDSIIRVISVSNGGFWRYLGYRKMNFLQYWLHCANKSRLKIRGVRLISSRFLSEELFLKYLPHGSYGAVNILIKYGAVAADTRKVSRDFVPEILVSTLSRLLYFGIEKRYWTEDLEMLVDLRRIMAQGRRVEQVKGRSKRMRLFEVASRNAMRKVPKRKLVTGLVQNFFMLIEEMENPYTTALYLADKYDPILKYRIPSVQKLLPFYVKNFPGCFYGHMRPPSLRHLCKHTIRKILHNNYQLPNGIRKLPVFPVLRDYISLVSR